MATPTQALVPRWLVVAVVVMGLLLVIGVVIVGTEVSRRLSSPKPAVAPAAAPSTASPDSAFRQKITLPPGSQVISMSAVGDRLIVQVENQEGLASAYVVDPRTGTLLGTIDFLPGAPR